MFKYTRQENGYSLLLVLMVVVLISVFGISLLVVTANSIKISTNERDNQSVFYIAEGGLNKTKSSLELLAKDTYKQTSLYLDTLPPKDRTPTNFKAEFIAKFDVGLSSILTRVPFEEQFNEHPVANITITKDPTTQLKYKIKSDGVIGIKKRTVAQEIIINLSPPPTGPYFTSTSAIHAIQNIDLGGGTFNGDIVSDKGKISITNGGTKVNGKIGTTSDKFLKPDWMNMSNEIIGNVAFPENILPTFPDSQFTKIWPYTNSVEVTIDGKQTQLSLKDNSIKIDGGGNGHINDIQKFNGTLPLNEDMYLKNLTVASKIKLTIDVGNSDKNLYIENFNLSEGQLNIVGKGKLTIYIKDRFSISGSSSMNSTGDIDRLSMYYAGTSQMNFEGATNTKASILYAKSASMNISASGSIEGNIYSGGSKITVDGGSYNHNLYIYAPSAEVSLGGSGNVTGGIMAKTVKTSGSPTVTYQTNTNQGAGGADAKDDAELEENYNFINSSGSMLEEE